MSLKSSQAARVIALSGLFLAVPMLAFEQRFGGSPSIQRASDAPQQTPPPSMTPGQRGGPGRPDQFVPWEWWKDDAIKKELKLTDMQVRRITRIYEDRSRLMKPHSDEFQKQVAELEKMTRERTVDVAAYAFQVTRVESLRTELSKTRTVMLYSIYRELSPEQYEKLRELRDRRRSGRSGLGPR